MLFQKFEKCGRHTGGTVVFHVHAGVNRVAVGKKANFYITTPVPGIEYLPYAYGSNLVEAVFLNGEQL